MNQHRPPRLRRSLVVTAWAAAGLVVIGSVTAATVLLRPTAAPHPASSQAAVHTTKPAPPPAIPPAPQKPTQEQLADVPLAYYDAMIPALLDNTTLAPNNQWEIAVPNDPLVALYASPSPDAAPIAAVGTQVRTVNTPTAVAVYGITGKMILVSTPSRNATPGPGAPAPSATFAWARAADFTITKISQVVMVDNAHSTISIVSSSGAVSASEVARLGTPSDPTPAVTSSYIESIYTDAGVTYTHGNPITLTGAHSSTLAGYGGNSALTALHYYPNATGNSHGCVRVSAAMTKALAALPIGTPVIFN